MEQFALAHVTDLHIGATPNVLGMSDWEHVKKYRALAKVRASPSSHEPDILTALAARLINRSPAVDGILLTGDLATSGTAPDLSAARSFIYGGAAASQTSLLDLQGIATALMILPGNHDRYRNWRMAPGGTLFDSTFVPDAWGPKRGVCSWEVTRGSETLVIVAGDLCLTDTSHASMRLGWLGQGMAYEDVLDEMKSVTVNARAPSRSRGHTNQAAVVWAVHFPPHFPIYPGDDPNLSLVHGHKLVAAAQSVGVGYVFAGHTHQRHWYFPRYAPSVQVLCGGTASQMCAPFGNSFDEVLFVVDRGRTVQLSTYRTWNWDESAGAFI